tara:strand:- start:19760 stop:19966 length:207 start_codon:yes stop_codon:yes gene_type:complete
MFEKFQNLDKKQKFEFYKVIGWSVISFLGGIQGANSVDSSLSDLIIGWVVGLVIIFIIFRVLRILKII